MRMTRSLAASSARRAARRASRMAISGMGVASLSGQTVQRRRRVDVVGQALDGRERALLGEAHRLLNLALDLLVDGIDVGLRKAAAAQKGVGELADGVHLAPVL